MNKTFVLISTIKKRAKQLRKELHLKWHQALDEASKEFGFTNFRNYQNCLKINNKQYRLELEDLFGKIRSEIDTSEKLELAISFIQNHQAAFRDIFEILKLFQHSDGLRYFEFSEYSDYLNHIGGLDPIQTICEKFMLMKEEIQKYLFDDFLTGDCISPH